MIHVGVICGTCCIIGTLDENNIPPSAPHLKLVYINYYDKDKWPNFIVAGKEELIIRDKTNELQQNDEME